MIGVCDVVSRKERECCLLVLSNFSTAAPPLPALKGMVGAFKKEGSGWEGRSVTEILPERREQQQ